MTDDAYSWPACASCFRDLHRAEVEAGRLCCIPCQERAERDLNALPGPHGLYAKLAGALAPGQTGDAMGRVTASRTAPLPLRLTPLSLSARGGVVTVLQDWRADWHSQLGWAPPRYRGSLQRQLDDTVKALAANLPWAASSHPAFGDFACETAHLVRACRAAVTDERPERRIAVQCPCGALLHITVSTPGTRCRACGVQYAREDVLELPLAARAMA